MLRLFIFFNLLLFTSCKSTNPNISEKPKLVVAIVVDQMRYDYLTRLSDKFSDNGFNRLINQGFNCSNNHYNYVPTVTGPGHASIATGSAPSIHGIVGNEWYDRGLKKELYCATDLNLIILEGMLIMGKNLQKTCLHLHLQIKIEFIIK